jgi:hypothetical protein
MRVRALVLVFAGVLAGACTDGGTPAPALKAVAPSRSSCPTTNESPSSENTVAVRIVVLCRDDVYGDYGALVTRVVPDLHRPQLELAVREVFECCPDRSDDLIAVTVDARLAVLDFPSSYRESAEWANVSTADGNRGFFPPLLETVFQFPEIDRVVMRFGGVPWWPVEDIQFKPIGRDSAYRVPLSPRRVSAKSAVAAVRYVASRLRSDFGDEDWYRRIREVTATATAVRVETALSGSEREVASEISAAVDAVLDRASARWCDVAIDVIARSGEAFAARQYAPRCD